MDRQLYACHAWDAVEQRMVIEEEDEQDKREGARTPRGRMMTTMEVQAWTPPMAMRGMPPRVVHDILASQKPSSISTRRQTGHNLTRAKREGAPGMEITSIASTEKNAKEDMTPERRKISPDLWVRTYLNSTISPPSPIFVPPEKEPLRRFQVIAPNTNLTLKDHTLTRSCPSKRRHVNEAYTQEPGWSFSKFKAKICE
ncbi:hypothetical protein M413DRAFT_29180 [Hebeloma cylindrosporum]|uniref:Uncharacterized protein n=1 Tax=Hebeloma cylindrosporum TaxID=76867 RepID=A0A0C3C753_HEBCY|nr:hypothetical protein M413DRAFT_29180 [Hebeloma cylindrosporum h7]